MTKKKYFYILRDFDAAETVPEKMSKVKGVKGVKGLVKLAKEIAVTATTGNHDNEFIGKCRIPLKVLVYPKSIL